MSASTHAAMPPFCSNGFALGWEVERKTTGHYLWQCISNIQHATTEDADFNILLSSHPCQLKIYTKLLPCMQSGLGS